MAEYNKRYLGVKRAAVDRAQAKGETGTQERGEDRLPPGQHLTTKFPILDLGYKPPIRLEEFTLPITGEVENPVTLDWPALTALPSVTRTLDFHCVTRWSQYDITWKGVPFAAICDLVKPKESARFVLQYGRDGYSTNLPLEEMLMPDVMVAYELEGEPVPLDHGGPVRILVPHLYAWKGSKFLNGIVFSPVDRPGFWEVRGYHNHGDPWKEERFG
ncbi:MAG: sulfite oxidase-like oxidoreductase [Armatimonadetes bacterium]|nr:sulfite oxidase-like oxidoreductase [Armatimonadota bacterium]